MDSHQPLKLTSRPALIVIDMQNAFCHSSGSFSQLVKFPQDTLHSMLDNINTLRKAFHSQNLPVIFVGYSLNPDYTDAGTLFDKIPHGGGEALKNLKFGIRGTWDAAIFDALKPDESKGEVFVEKFRDSAFAGPSKLEEVLREKGVDQILCTGLATNMCVECTVRDAIGRDRNAVTVGDACGAVTREEHEASLRNLVWFGGVSKTEEVVEALGKRGS